MKSLIRRIALGFGLVLAGAGIAAPIAYNRGYSSGEVRGKTNGRADGIDLARRAVEKLAEIQFSIARRAGDTESQQVFRHRGFILEYAANWSIPYEAKKGD